MRLCVLFLALLPLSAAALTDEQALELFNRARGGNAAALADLRRAAEGGDAPAQFQLGRAYSHGASMQRDDALAAQWVEKAAGQGHVEAQSNMGYLYSVGLGVPQDNRKAMEWWVRAADTGHVQGQFNLGLAYLRGEVTAKDEGKAFGWMSKAAAQGAAAAQVQVGYMYQHGIGTTADMSQAAAWYRKAGEQGNSVAAYNLARMYERGDGVARDPAEALLWARRAVARGNPGGPALEAHLCRNNAGLCERNQAAAHFVYELSDPRIRVVIPDIPPITMGPHPLGQPHARAMGSGPGGLTISVLVPTADQGMNAMDCARSRAASVAQRFGLNREDAVVHRTNESTLVMLFPLKTASVTQLKAFVLSGAGTHCVEVHLSNLLLPSAPASTELAAWMAGFRNARVEPY